MSHLEDIVEEIGYVLEKDSEYCQRILEDEEEVSISVTQKGGKTMQHQVTTVSLQQYHRMHGSGVCDLCMCNPACLFQEVILRDPSSGWDLGPDLDHFSSRTRHVLQYMNPNKINMDLLVELIAYLGTKHRLARVVQHGALKS